MLHITKTGEATDPANTARISASLFAGPKGQHPCREFLIGKALAIIPDTDASVDVIEIYLDQAVID